MKAGEFRLNGSEVTFKDNGERVFQGEANVNGRSATQAKGRGKRASRELNGGTGVDSEKASKGSTYNFKKLLKGLDVEWKKKKGIAHFLSNDIKHLFNIPEGQHHQVSLKSINAQNAIMVDICHILKLKEVEEQYKEVQNIALSKPKVLGVLTQILSSDLNSIKYFGEIFDKFFSELHKGYVGIYTESKRFIDIINKIQQTGGKHGEEKIKSIDLGEVAEHVASANAACELAHEIKRCQFRMKQLFKLAYLLQETRNITNNSTKESVELVKSMEVDDGNRQEVVNCIRSFDKFLMLVKQILIVDILRVTFQFNMASDECLRHNLIFMFSDKVEIDRYDDNSKYLTPVLRAVLLIIRHLRLARNRMLSFKDQPTITDFKRIMTILRVSMGNVDAAKKYISDYMDKSFGDNDSNSDYSSSPLYNGLVAIKSSLESLLKDLENCNLNKLEQSTKQSRRDAGYLEGTAAARRKPKNKRNKKKKKKNNKSRKKVPIKQRTVSQPKVDEEAKLRLDAKRAKEECDMIVAKERAMSMASNALNKRVVEVADKEEEEVRPEGEAGKDLKKHADLFTQLTTKSAGSLHYKVKTEEVLKLLSKFGFGYKKVDGSKYSVSMLGDKGHIIIHNGHGNKDINGKLDSLSISLVQMLLLPESNRQVG